MKKLLILGTSLALLTACDKQEQAERNRIEQESEAQKSALNQEKKDVNAAASDAKDQVTDQAKMERKRIENQAEAQKDAIDAEKKRVEDRADTAKANVNDSVNDTKNDLRGLNPGFRGQNSLNPADRTMTESLQRAWKDNTDYKNVTYSSIDGEVTLRGTVRTEQAKDNVGKAVKAFPGVKSVDNKIDVTP